jgi:hypothetical protein
MSPLHRASTLVLAVASTGLALAATLAGASPVLAASVSSAPSRTASPAIGCNPPAGTILSAKATSDHTAWEPTSISSSFLAGPGTITKTVSATSTVGASISASFAISESLLFASAKETYGVTLSGSLSHSSSWSYSKSIPSGVTAKVQQYHQASELGIKEVVVTSTASKPCGTTTKTKASGNFFPHSSTADDTYCYGATIYKNPGVQVRSRCVNTLP